MRTYCKKILNSVSNFLKKCRKKVNLEKKQDRSQSPEQKKDYSIKRKDILICPYFKLIYFVSHNVLTIDMSCVRDHMIFCTRNVALAKFESQRDQILQNIRTDMIECCALDCLKLWHPELDRCEVDECFDDELSFLEEDDFLKNGWKDQIKENDNEHPF